MNLSIVPIYILCLHCYVFLCETQHYLIKGVYLGC
jgi:hypothetical protein